MRLEEAIQHAEEKGHGTNACATEHRQLAKWLRELLKHRRSTRDGKKQAMMEQFARLYGAQP